MEQREAALIGLDWGSSRVRAYRFDQAGNVVATRSRPWGVLRGTSSDFAAAYAELSADWLRPAEAGRVIACGMIGSTEGWVPAPYCACPAGLGELADALVDIPVDAGRGVVVAGGAVSGMVVPGVAVSGAEPDVMRGEETQVVGALALRPELGTQGTLLLPGTHAKWVVVREARITRFATYLTGELFAVLSEHSILGRPARRAAAAAAAAQSADLATDDADADSEPVSALDTEESYARAHWEAFDRGVTAAREARPRGIAPLLFRARSLVLTDQLEAVESLAFLSGLLIGDEIRAGLAADSVAPLTLVGEPALCMRYRRALQTFGVAAPIVDNAAPAGLLAIARCAQIAFGSLSRA